MTREEIIVHLVAGMLAGKPFYRHNEVDQTADIQAMYSLAARHAERILNIQMRDSERTLRVEDGWLVDAEELLKQAGRLAIHVREGNGPQNYRASVVATFAAMLRLLNGIADGNANADSVRRALGRIP